MTVAEVIDRLIAENLARRQAEEALARTVRCPRCGAGRDATCRTERKARASRSHVARVLESREQATS